MKCLNCNAETKNLKFCTKSCSAIFNNTLRKKTKYYQCLSCRKNVLFNNRKKNLYCSSKCQGLFQFKTETTDRIVKGLVVCPKVLKKYLLAIRPHCSMCGLGQFWNENKLTLQLDHIDGNSDNNFPNNLRLLCPNCHSQTSTFAGKHKVKKDSKRNRYLRKFKGYQE
jgi:hypothetical protein